MKRLAINLMCMGIGACVVMAAETYFRGGHDAHWYLIVALMFAAYVHCHGGD